MFDLLLAEAKERVHEAPFDSIDLMHAAVFVADLLPRDVYGEERTSDFRGTAYAALGNIKRILGDFDGAKAALVTARGMLERGTGDPYEAANLISITSSLQTDLGFLEEATEVLCGAILLARRVKDSHLEGRLRVQQSSSIGWIDPERGLVLAQQGLSLVRESATADDYLSSRGTFTWMSCGHG